MNLILPESVYRRDSTKTNDYLDCPRKFFFDRVLGWRKVSPGQDKVFGSCVHTGFEEIYPEDSSPLYTRVAAKRAYDAFVEEYRETFPPETDVEYKPKYKTPDLTKIMFEQYVDHYRGNEKFEKVIYNEIAGSVNIDERRIYFRLDTIIEHETHGIISRDHKTRGSQGFGRTWIDQFALSVQVGTYNHVLYCLFEPSSVGGVQINGVAFPAKRLEKPPDKLFCRINRELTVDQMLVWLSTVKRKFDDMDRDFELLNEEVEHRDKAVMESFPLNPASCTKYWGCPFLDFCMAWANPLQYVDMESIESIAPPGFEVDHWDPLKMVEEARHSMDLNSV